MKKTLVLSTAILLAGVATGFAADKYPSRDITNIVVWAAGGGTDLCNRIVSAEMAKILGVNINVTNKTGGVSGSIGMDAVYNEKPDGYTIAGISESVVTAAVQGGWNKRMEVWSPFIIGGSPDVVSVTASAPYKNLKELIEAAKAEPNKIKASASAAGSIHHLNLLALMNGSGAKFNYIPYDGSAPAQNAAMSGEVTVVVTSVAEQQQLLKGKRLRPLGMLTPDSFTVEGVGTIPSSFTDYAKLKEYLPISQAIGFAVRSDTPEDVKKVLGDAFEKALKAPAVQKWTTENYYTVSGKHGKAAQAEFARLESLFGWTLWELKAAKISPEQFSIPKP